MTPALYAGVVRPAAFMNTSLVKRGSGGNARMVLPPANE